jgi:hypothetical protein
MVRVSTRRHYSTLDSKQGHQMSNSCKAGHAVSN